MTGLRGELRVVVRGLVRRPGFTAVALAILGLGIGANAVLFSLVKSVVLRPLPFAEPDRLVRIWGTQNGQRVLVGTLSYPDVHDIGAAVRSLEAWSAFDEWTPAAGPEGGPPEVVYGATVNANFFEVLGVEPQLGRFFRADEEGPDRELRVVIGYELWQRWFGGSAEVLQRPILISGIPVQVIGVLPSGFESPGLERIAYGAPEIWRTVAAPPGIRNPRSWVAVARLRDGATLATAQAEVDAATAVLERRYPYDDSGWGADLVPIRDQLLGNADRVLGLLVGAAVLVLLIACANVGSLLLVRAVERRRELEVRAALGASQERLMVASVLESAVLAVTGAALGVALAYLALPVSRASLQGLMPRIDSVRVDGSVAFFGAAIAIVVALLTGVAPTMFGGFRDASRGNRGRIAAAARGSSAGIEDGRVRRALVVTEVALSVVLLYGAGVLVRSVHALYTVELGVAREGVVTATLHPSAFEGMTQEDVDADYARILGALRALPGVRAAGRISLLPFAGAFSCHGVRRNDLPPPAPGEERCAEIRSIVPGTLEALGVRVVQGRLTEDADHRAGAARVALVSEEMAQAFWPGETPVGKSVQIHDAAWTVVGVVSNVRHFGPAGETRPQAYLPAQLDPRGGAGLASSLLVRGSGDADALAPAVRDALLEAKPNVVITSIRSMDEMLERSVAQPRLSAILLGSLAALAALLALVGLGGVITHSARQRTREISLRLALGATPRGVSIMVLSEAVRLVAAGAMAGLIAAILFAGALKGMVFGVGARDPWAIAAAPLLIALMGLAVSWLPARRAARIEPLRGLAAD
jgi:putative ABC transport system permease protein